MGNLVPRGERLMSLLSRSHVLVCTCYNSFGHTVTAGSGFAPMIRDDTTANVHTTIRSIATGVLQNSSQITKEEENDFFPLFTPLHSCTGSYLLSLNITYSQLHGSMENRVSRLAASDNTQPGTEEWGPRAKINYKHSVY